MTNQKTEKKIAKLLTSSFKQIDWEYCSLTTKERKIVKNEKEFKAIRKWIKQKLV